MVGSCTRAYLFREQKVVKKRKANILGENKERKKKKMKYSKKKARKRKSANLNFQNKGNVEITND